MLRLLSIVEENDDYGVFLRDNQGKLEYQHEEIKFNRRTLETIRYEGGTLEFLREAIGIGSVILITVNFDERAYCYGLNTGSNAEFIQVLLSICKAFNIDPVEIMPFRLMDDKGVQYDILAEGFDLRQQQSPP